MPMVKQPVRELPEPRKKGHRLLAVCTQKKMANVGSSRTGCAFRVLVGRYWRGLKQGRKPHVKAVQYILQWGQYVKFYNILIYIIKRIVKNRNFYSDNQVLLRRIQLT
jgi:hypothetical protein